MKELQILFKKYHIGENFSESSNTGLQGKCWYYFFAMTLTYLRNNGEYNNLEAVLIMKWMKHYWNAMSIKFSNPNFFEDPEDAEFYSLLSKLESEYKIMIPSIIKKIFNGKSNVNIGAYCFNCYVSLKDIEDFAKIIDVVLVVAMLNDKSQKSEKKLFQLYAYDEKIGIARASGNGAVVTLPKDWIGKKIQSLRIT